MITRSIKDMYKRIIPIPKKVEFNEELIQLGDDWGIELNKDFEHIAEKWINKLGLSRQKCDKAIILMIDSELEEEEYKITIYSDKLNVFAGTEKGFGHALKTLFQLSPEGKIPTGCIEDKPLLKMRGFHVNPRSFCQMDIEDVLYVLKTAADLKLNTVLLEYGNRFPFEKHKKLNVKTTFKRENLKRITDAAEELGLSVIPLQQTIGHLEYMFCHEEYASISENNKSDSQICPLNTDSFAVVKELLDEIIEAHPGIKSIHIGGDETRNLGECPKCREKKEKESVSKLYIDYINSVCDYVCSKGLTPYIWDDMICAHPEALELLDKRVSIMYWDYWTVSKESPYLVARYDRDGEPAILHDNRWDTEWSNEIGDLEKAIMSVFSPGVPLVETLGENFMDLYGKWLGDEFPKKIKAFPYLDFFMDKGFKVVGAPTSLGNGDNYHTLPNYWRFIPNIRTVCERCIEAGAEGVITTAWYNYHPSMFHLGIGVTAQFAWGIPL